MKGKVLELRLHVFPPSSHKLQTDVTPLVQVEEAETTRMTSQGHGFGVVKAVT